MTTSQVIAAWTTPQYYCQKRGDYYFNLHQGQNEVTTQARAHGMCFYMHLGRRVPGTKIHAKYWIKNGCIFNTISHNQILPIKEYCDMIGFEPIFKFTKSGTFVRMVNYSEFNLAIKKHFQI